MAGFDVVAFDVYGTLFDIEGEDWAPREVVVAARAKQLQYSWLSSLMGEYRPFTELTRLAVEQVFEARGFSGSVDGAMRAMNKIRLFPDAMPALERMKRSARLAVLSNGDVAWLETLLAGARVRDHFTWLVSADEVRVYKPAPAVYQRLLDRTGAERRRLLFVSSNAWDAQGAAAFGLRVAWVNRSRAPAERIGRKPETEVASLEQVAELIDRPG